MFWRKDTPAKFGAMFIRKRFTFLSDAHLFTILSGSESRESFFRYWLTFPRDAHLRAMFLRKDTPTIYETLLRACFILVAVRTDVLDIVPRIRTALEAWYDMVYLKSLPPSTAFRALTASIFFSHNVFCPSLT
jgi:hypothetical protein